MLLLSSGEIGIAEKVAEDGRGRKVAAGQQVRVLDLPAEAGAGMGLFENLHGFPSADAFAHGRSLAGDLVAEAQPRRRRELTSIEVQVAAADAAVSHAHQDVTRLHLRPLDLLHLEALGTGDDGWAGPPLTSHPTERLPL